MTRGNIRFGAPGARGVWLVAGLLLLMLLAHRVAAGDEGVVEIVVGDQEHLTQPAKVERTAIGSGEVASVQVADERSLLVTAQEPGTTSLRIWLEGRERPRELRVRVLPEGSVGLEEEYLYDQLSARSRISGDTESLERHAQARQRFDDEVIDATRQVGAVQVQADIRVVEVNRRKLQASGFFIGRQGGGSSAGFGVGDRSSVLSFLGGDGAVAPGSEGFSIIRANTSGVLTALSALNSNGFAYTLAEPSLVTLSGQTATFLAGGEFPFPSSSSDGEVSIDYREFGVRLRLTPTVLDEQRIMMKVAPEVSELDFSQGVETGGVSVPALNVRRTDTTIQLGHGESFIISGLVSHNVIQNVDRIPGLGDIPVLGAFFRSTRLERDEKELVMIVTPYLVWPMAAGSDLEAPGEALRRYRPSYLELLMDPRDAERIEGMTEVGFSR